MKDLETKDTLQPNIQHLKAYMNYFRMYFPHIFFSAKSSCTNDNHQDKQFKNEITAKNCNG